MPQPPSVPRGSTLAGLAPPILLSYLLNWFFFGVLSMQVYDEYHSFIVDTYFLAFPNDTNRLKILVYSLYIIEVAQNFLLLDSAIYSFGDNFGDTAALDRLGTLWFSVPLFTGIVVFLSQAFYAYRIDILSHSKVVPTLVIALAVLQLGGAISCAALANDAVFTRPLRVKDAVSVGIWNGASALCDVIIAICLTFYLSRFRANIQSTRSALRRLIPLIVGTGSLTAIVAIINLILLVSLPRQTPYWLVTMVLMGKLYSNSMMVVLNSRARDIGAASECELHFDNDSSTVAGHRLSSDADAERPSTEMILSPCAYVESGDSDQQPTVLDMIDLHNISSV